MDHKLPMTSYEYEGLKRLRCTLVNMGFVDLLVAYGSEEERGDVLRFDLSLLPKKLRLLVQFFCLGEAIAFSAVVSLLSKPVLDSLHSLNIAVYTDDEKVSLGVFRLVYHFGVLIFCHQPDIFANLYYSNDSLALGRLVRLARGRVLDMCAGVGTQGMLAALTATSLVSVEAQDAAAPIYWINAVLNNIEQKVELRIGNFLETVQDERFDQVCCNPPLLPIPGEISFPFVGGGGPDGLAITRRLLYQLPALLTPNGRCHIVGTLLGDAEAPDLEPFLQIVEERNLCIQLIMPKRVSLDAGQPMLESLVETASVFGNIDRTCIRERFLEGYARMAADHLYFFLLGATVATSETPKGLTVTQHYLRGGDAWTV